MRFLALLAIALLGSTLPMAVCGGESELSLADAPELPLVRARCSICHSVDYLPMNAPFLDRAAWEAEVRKMMKVMGAPVEESEVGAIVDYLSAHYGAR